MRQKKSASILRKFLLFNLGVFSILGLFTIIYLKAIQPNLIKKRAANHYIIIQNTVDHLDRLNINFESEEIKTFLYSTRFLFQSLDRVQFYNNRGKLIGDTNILDLDQSVFMKSEAILEETIDGITSNESNFENTLKIENDNSDKIKNSILEKFKEEPLVLEKKKNINFFVRTL